MVPTPLAARHPHSARLLYTLLSLATKHVSRLFQPARDHVLAKRDSSFNPHQPKYIVFAVLIPVFVCLSGVFAGLTLGYMSLDETQLNVLSISGTPCVSFLPSLPSPTHPFLFLTYTSHPAPHTNPKSYLLYMYLLTPQCPQQPTTRICQQNQAHPQKWPPSPRHPPPCQHDRQ